MSRTGFQYAMAALGAILADPEEIDVGVARSIHAGLDAAAKVGRELSDLEQIALDNLMGQLTPHEDAPHPSSEGETSEPAGAGVGEPAEAPAEPVAQAEEPSVENEALFGEDAPGGA